MTTIVTNLQKTVRAVIGEFTAKSGPLSLRANFSWAFIGNTVYRGSQWAILVILAKLTTPEEVGRFALGLALTAPVIMFTNLQLREVQATDAKHEYTFGDYLSLRLVMSAVAIIVVALISVISGYRWEIILVILMVGASKVVESISDVYYGLYQQRERMDRIAIAFMLKGPLSLLVLGIVVYLTRDIAWGVLGLVITWLALLLFYDIPTGRYILQHFKTEQEKTNQETEKLRLRWHLPTLWKLAWLSVPLGVGMMLISLNTNVPRYAVEHFLGERELGIFTALAYLVEAGRLMTMAMGHSAVPRLAQYYAAQRRRPYRKLLLRLGAIGLALGLLGVVVAVIGGKPLLTLIYTSEYADHMSAFILIMISGGIGYLSYFLGNGMMASRHFSIQAPLFGLVTACTAIASLILIPAFGLNGAALALIVSALVQLAGSLAVNMYALRKLPLQASTDN